ncbi:hypothetical protein NDU88_001235, partial [Pleurodeles waltl]
PSSLRRSSQGVKDRTVQTTRRQHTCRVSRMGNYNALMSTVSRGGGYRPQNAWKSSYTWSGMGK